jgi:hypothetical protein
MSVGRNIDFDPRPRLAVVPMSAVEILGRLRALAAERFEAERAGLMACPEYRRDLEQEWEDCRTAFVGTAVTEIAVLRSELWGRELG